MAQTLLLVGTDKTKLLEKAKNLAGQSSSSFDTVFLDANEFKGIAAVRELLTKAYRKPFNSKILTLVITNSDQLTAEAQNALLKLLEEPPAETQIILTTQNRDKLLPTVSSRCLVVELTQTAADNQTAAFVDFFTKKFSEKLELLDKEGIEPYIFFLEKQLRSRLQESVGEKTDLADLTKKLKFALKLNKATKTAVNKKLISLLLVQK